MFLKFGIGRATSDAAHEIRDKHLTREEAVKLVKKYDGEFPKKINQFLELTTKKNLIKFVIFGVQIICGLKMANGD